MERYRRDEISLGRIAAGLVRRLADIRHAVSWLFSNEAANNRNSLQTFHGLHAGKRCVVIANGPSLLKTNTNLLLNELTIGMNRIYLHFPKMGFETSYYVAINDLVINQFKDEISTLKMPKFLNWNQRNLFSTNAPGTNYLKTNLGLQDEFSKDICKPISSGGTVTFVALQLAYYMGFNEVVLIGLDHRFASSGTPNKVERRDNSKDESHFHPGYFPPGSRWQLPDLRRSELAYEKARRAFEAAGRRILDATEEGACQVFEKVKYSSLFK